MDKNLLKPILALVGIIVVSVALVRGCSGSETLAEYAERTGQDTKAVLPTVEPVSDAVSSADAEATGAAADGLAEATIAAEATETAKSVEATEAARSAEATAAAEASATAEASAAAKASVAAAQAMAGAGMTTVEVKADVTETRIYAADDQDFYIEEISQDLLNSMKGRSYAADIDESIVNATMLRHVVIKYVDFNGETQTGELVCNEKIAVDMLEIFEELYKAGYQLEKVKLIDEYNADDDASMEDNNTSCFNYRVVDRTDKLSYHAYGLAIDVNPFYNPYVIYHTDKEDYICPTQSAPYAYRDKEFAYKIDENDLACKLFKEHGFIWGGDWNSCKDYQHFEKRVR